MSEKERWLGGAVFACVFLGCLIAWLAMALGVETNKLLADLIDLYNSIMGA